MQIDRKDNQTEHVLSVAGEIGPAEAPELRGRLLEAVEGGDSDVLLDAHDVTVFDDDALTALTAARIRAKHLRRHLVVLDDEDGPVTNSLRRTGLRFRFPVYRDAAAAAKGLAADRAALIRRSLHVKAALNPLPAAPAHPSS